jgi:hypothetical protein
MTALPGDQPGVPCHIPFAVPTATVLSAWPEAAGPEPALRLQQMVLAAVTSEHEARDYRPCPAWTWPWARRTGR